MNAIKTQAHPTDDTVLLSSLNLGRWRNPIGVGMLALLTIFRGAIFYWGYCAVSDWTITFYPATKNLFSANLYALEGYGFFFPAWVLLPVFPISFLPIRPAGTLVSLLCLAALGYVAWKRGAKPWPLAFFLFMPQVGFLSGNGDMVDALTALGFILPPQIGLFLVLAKPQAGAAVAIYWLVEAWRKGGVREAARVFAPVTAAYGLLLGLYHPNLLDAWKGANHWVGMGASHDVNLWPYGVVIGVVLLAQSVRKRSLGLAICSSVCFAPYVGFYSWPVALLGLLPDNRSFSWAVAAMWVVGLASGLRVL